MDADSTGNGYGWVSNMELWDFLDQFDTNNDGEITTYTNIIGTLFGDDDEWEEFVLKYGERYKYEKE